MPCPFCEILTTNTERIVRQTKHSFVVLSQPRLVPGHLLVIPKRHVEKFSELKKNELAELFSEAIKLEEEILRKLASGCDFSQHFRPFIQQNRLKVNHLHIHLRPREFEDELYHRVQKFEKNVFTDLSDQEFKKYRKMFKE